MPAHQLHMNDPHIEWLSKSSDLNVMMRNGIERERKKMTKNHPRCVSECLH